MECALTLSSCWLPILCVDENKTETEGSQVMRKRKRGGREGGVRKDLCLGDLAAEEVSETERGFPALLAHVQLTH